MQPLGDALERLSAVITERRRHATPEESYVAKLCAKGRKKIAQKIGEEGVEVAIAAVGDDQSKIASESADLLFHLLVLWEHAGINPIEVARALEKREGVSGLVEKKSRNA